MTTTENVVFSVSLYGKVVFRSCVIQFFIYDALRDLVPFVQFKKRGKQPMEECYF